MESEQAGQSYRAPKTAKIFVSAILSAFQKREGDKLARQLKDLYFTNLYDNVSHKNWTITINIDAFSETEGNMGRQYGKMLELIRSFAQERAAKKWAECFEKHMQTVIALLRVLEEMKEMKLWVAKSLIVVMRATKKLFLVCENRVSNSNTAAKLKNSLFNTLSRFKTTKSLDELVRRQFLSLLDVMQVSILLFFHNYEQIQRLIYSNKIYGEISDRYIDNFMFQKGKYSLINEKFSEAEQCFMKIALRTRGQRRLIMRYLIPCRIFMGKLYEADPNRDDQQFPQYACVIKAIKTADFKDYEEISQKYQKLWLKRGIYLLMDRVRIILWRTLVKRLFLIAGTKLDFQMIEKAVRLRGGSESIDECVCIVANLVYQGYIKGYIFQNQTKRILVLKSNGNPFPKLQSLVR